MPVPRPPGGSPGRAGGEEPDQELDGAGREDHEPPHHEEPREGPVPTGQRQGAMGVEQGPQRMTEGGRYLVERTRMSGGGDTLFGCSGPRFTSPTGQTLVVDIRDSIVEECRRGVRFGGAAQGLVSKTTVVASRLRGLLFSGSARGRVWDSSVVGNGGYGSSELGFGGVAVTDSARVDLGGGAVLVDGSEAPSPGRNTICNNISLGDDRLDVQNLTIDPVFASGNYWCTLEPSPRLAGSVVHEPLLDVAP